MYADTLARYDFYSSAFFDLRFWERISHWAHSAGDLVHLHERIWTRQRSTDNLCWDQQALGVLKSTSFCHLWRLIQADELWSLIGRLVVGDEVTWVFGGHVVRAVEETWYHGDVDPCSTAHHARCCAPSDVLVVVVSVGEWIVVAVARTKPVLSSVNSGAPLFPDSVVHNIPPLGSVRQTNVVASAARRWIRSRGHVTGVDWKWSSSAHCSSPTDVQPSIHWNS